MTMLDMANMEIIPSVLRYKGDLTKTAKNSLAAGVDANDEIDMATALAKLVRNARERVAELQSALDKAHSLGINLDGGRCYRDEVLPAMTALREVCDEMELNTAKSYWPFPNYGDILFSVH